MGLFTKLGAMISLLLLSFYNYGATIKGHVYDKTTKEQLVGAYVTIKSISKNSVTELDGSYVFKDVAPGIYLVSLSYLGYDNQETTITVGDTKQEVKYDFYLKPSSHEMNEVEVKTKAYGGSDEFATKAEQKSISLVNIVSANAIQISPDITVANVMQRISGVTMTRGNSGEAQYAIIRGMSPRYNTTLVNGIKIPSPNDKDRYVPLDIFPADLLERVEVIKSLTPSMEGDGTGGVINMVMKNAPEKLTIDANIGGGYNDIFQKQDFLKFSTAGVNLKSPAELLGPGVSAPVSDFQYNSLLTHDIRTPINSVGGLTIGNRFMKKKLGVIISGSYQNTYKGSNSNLLQQVGTIEPVPTKNSELFQPVSDILVRQYSTLSQRLGTEAKVDYDINDNNSLSLFVTYLQLNEFMERTELDSLLGGTHMKNDYTIITGYGDNERTRQELQNIFNATLSGKHKLLKNLNADWTLAGSEAKRQLPDIAKYAINNAVNYDSASNPLQTLGPSTVGKETHEWEHNTDKDLSGYYNFHYTSNLIPGLTNIDFGGMYNHKTRDNYDNQYTLNPNVDTGKVVLVNGAQAYTSIPASQFYFQTGQGLGNAAGNAGIYTFTENILAYYLQLHENVGDKVKLDGGVRIENTDASYVSSLPVSLPGKDGDYVYTDVLPSIMGKYELSGKSAVRASYFKSIDRPAFSEYIPFGDNSTTEDYSTYGNPYLQHAVIENYDLRYELFPKGLDEILAGVFYKQLHNAIQNTLLPPGTSGFGSTLDYTPENTPIANNYGLELVYRRYFGNFGVSVNYTYTKSVVTTWKKVYVKDSVTNISSFDSVQKSLPLQGQAENIGNLSLLYRNTKAGLDAQIAFLYTGELVYAVSGYSGLDTWEKPILSLDFSLQKKIGKHFTVYFKAHNLLNSGKTLFIKQNNEVAYSGDSKLPFQESNNYLVVEQDQYYSSFLFGLRYKF